MKVFAFRRFFPWRHALFGHAQAIPPKETGTGQQTPTTQRRKRETSAVSRTSAFFAIVEAGDIHGPDTWMPMVSSRSITWTSRPRIAAIIMLFGMMGRGVFILSGDFMNGCSWVSKRS
jgi:hypothetical protein